MAEDLQRRLALAAAAGLVAGLMACNEAPPPQDPSNLDGPTPAPAGADTGDEPDATDIAAGDKGCCGPKTNPCAGKGGCAADDHACAGKNACKGQGGCFAKGCDKDNSRAARLEAEEGGAQIPEGESTDSGD